MSAAIQSHKLHQAARVARARALGSVISAAVRGAAYALCRLRARAGLGGTCLETKAA